MLQTNLSAMLEIFAKMVAAKARVKVIKEPDPSEWSTWLTSPVPGYVELDQYGPVSLQQVEWMEIRVS